MQMTGLRGIIESLEGGVISIVGAGGKTTLLFALAREIAAAGETVLTTTTTKILKPSPEESPQVIVSSHPQEILNQVRRLPRDVRHVTAGRDLIAGEKLAGFTPEEIAALKQGGLFRWILVEADGAKQRPLKAPAAHEPVIPPCSRAVIAVIGLDALGQPLTEDWVFRSSLFGRITGLSPGERITGQSIAAALTHAEGIMKGTPPGARRLIFLNKADTHKRREAGHRIAELIKETVGMQTASIIIASLREGAEASEYLDPPRDEAREELIKPPTAGIILAAGMSSRMGKGKGPKQLLEAGGKPLLAWVLEAALESDLGEIVLVLGYEAGRIRTALGPLAADRRLKIVENERYREGMASSLQAGLSAIGARFTSVMFLLGDQPLLGAETINLLLESFHKSGKGICVPVWGRRRGNPVIFSDRYYDEIFAIGGDRGAREIIDRHPRDILPVTINDPHRFLDIDSPDDAQTLLPLIKGKERS